MSVLKFKIRRIPIIFPEYGNVKAKAVLDSSTHKPTFMLEALDYDTLWRIHVAYILNHPSWAGDDDAMRMIIYLAESSMKTRDDLSDNDSDWKISVRPVDIVDKLQIPFKKVNWIWKEMERKSFIYYTYSGIFMSGHVRWPLRIHQHSGHYTLRFYGIRLNYFVKPEEVIDLRSDQS